MMNSIMQQPMQLPAAKAMPPSPQAMPVYRPSFRPAIMAEPEAKHEMSTYRTKEKLLNNMKRTYQFLLMI